MENWITEDFRNDLHLEIVKILEGNDKVDMNLSTMIGPNQSRYRETEIMKTTRVYGVNLDLILDGLEHQRLVDFEVSDDEFMEIAEEHGLIWTLKCFEHDYNSSDIHEQVLIRIINVETRISKS